MNRGWRFYLLGWLCLLPIFCFSQVVEEKVQLDTITETIKVIYRPTTTSTYYTKKTAVFADDTSQIAIEKSFNGFGQNGLYKVYYPSGRLKVKTVFANNKINGEWTWYDENGIIRIKGVYEDGVKDGYWAYKWLRIYGRYKDGKKHKKWKRFDKNDKKYVSHYRNGVLTAGEGYGNEKLFYENTSDTTKAKESESDTSFVEENTLSKEYEQAIAFLSRNVVFRKAMKEYFGTTLKEIRAIKKYFVKENFQFVVAPQFVPLGINKFISSSEEGTLVVAKIDTLLRKKKNEIKLAFSNAELEQNVELQSLSSNENSPMTVFFSKVVEGLLRIDIVKYEEISSDNLKYEKKLGPKEDRAFEVLLYFDFNKELKGAEYEKR